MKISDLEKDTHFLATLKTAMYTHSQRYNLSCLSYFGSKIGFGKNSDKSCSKLFSENTIDFMKIEQLFIILNILDDDLKKEVLDFLANKYDFVLVPRVDEGEKDFENIKDLLLSFSTSNGDLISNFFDFKSNDNKIDSFEAMQLIKQSYAFRQLLVKFEKEIEQIIEEY